MSKLESDRLNAKQGEFFFARFRSESIERPSPVLVVGNDNDKLDVIICKCTSQPVKSQYDKVVQLKRESVVRTNKIYTIGRHQLEFKIENNNVKPEEINEIINTLKTVF